MPDRKPRVWSTRLIAVLAGVGSLTLLAGLGVITGGVAVPAIVGLVGLAAGAGGYARFRRKKPR